MANRFGVVLQQLRHLIGDRQTGDATDGQLLDRYVAQREEGAFAELVQRYGPLVLGLCRRLLGHAHDAEDAFQATFLVLARKAGSIRKHESVGSWLYGVAYRVAQEAKVKTARRQAKEKPAADMAISDTHLDRNGNPAAVNPARGLADRELFAVLDDELHRLPEKYRVPLILCCLEGKTNQEAALRLGCPASSLSSRLLRARELLRQRLSQRGVALSLATLTTALTTQQLSAAVPGALAEQAVRTALRFAAGQAVTAGAAESVVLAEAILRAATLHLLKMAALILLAVLGSLSAGVYAHRGLTAGPAPAAGRVQPAAGLPTEARFSVVLQGHKGTVRTVTFSPDGSLIVTGGLDATAKVWDLNGQERATLSKHGQLVYGLQFLDGGKTLLTASEDMTLRWWDVPSWQPRRSIPVSERLYLLARSSDGRTLAAMGSSRMARLLDAATGQVRATVHPEQATGPASSLAWSPNGVLLATGSKDGTLNLWHAPVWDFPQGKIRPARQLEGHSSRIVEMWFSADGSKLATQGANHAVLVWDLARGQVEGIFHPTSRLFALAFSADGTLIAGGSQDGTFRIWTTATGTELLCVRGHQDKVVGVAFGPDGRTLATASEDGTAKLWKLVSSAP